MVTREGRERYESQQLLLIAEEYRRQGFSVLTEVALPGSQARLDIVARRASDDMHVIVELLSAARAEASGDARVEILQRAAMVYPSARVELRYLDEQAAPYTALLSRTARAPRMEDLWKALKRRLPSKKTDELSRNSQLLELWAVHALTIRAVALAMSDPLLTSENVLDVYNALLRHQILLPPEAEGKSVTLSLFQIHEAVLAATQGAIVDLTFVTELRLHVQSVRQQVRDNKSAMQTRMLLLGHSGQEK